MNDLCGISATPRRRGKEEPSIIAEITRTITAIPKKKTSPDQTVATICQEALRGADATMAAVRSTVKIDDLLALHQRLTGRPATPAEIADLEKKMGQKASPN
jgi:hypothetical protein